MANKNPSPETRFGAPKGPPSGKTSRQRELEYMNAEAATEIRARFLARLRTRVQDDSVVDAAINAALDKLNLNALLREAEDRGLGTPKTSVDITTNGKDLAASIDLSTLSSEALAEIVAARDAAAKD